MCGIVGYIGKNQAAPIVLKGLKTLEYRGYDSVGLACLSRGRLLVKKDKGKLEEVDKKLRLGEMDGCLCLGHNRWATHGQPSKKNAHPHLDCSGKIALVHNGIIENYQELKDQLIKEGHRFRSETDTEVIVHLIEKYYFKNQGTRRHRNKRTISLEKAVFKTLAQLRGAYAIAVISADEPDKIVAARLSSPLVLGLGKDEFILASDPSAIINYTKKVIYLDDREIVVIQGKNYKIINFSQEPTKKEIATLSEDTQSISKAGFPHFMLKEIHEAAEAIINSTRGRMIIPEGLVKLGGLEQVEEKLREIDHLIIVACGTARYAALVGEYMLEEYAGIPTEVEYASEFRYRKPLLDENTALLAISQSGETADTLAAIREAKRKGILTLGLVNVVGSSVARETEAGVYNHIGPELAVASTKAFVSQMVILALLTVFLGRQREMSLVMGKRILEEIQRLPKKLVKIFHQEETIKKIAQKYKNYPNFLYLGRKYNYPLALEGALKLKEVSYLHAEGYASGEMKHGPIALIDKDFPCFFILPQDSVYEKNLSNLEEIKARGGKIISLMTEGDRQAAPLSDEIIIIPKTLEMLTPILTAIPLHLFAYYLAVARKLDPDRPRNLAKSVTVE